MDTQYLLGVSTSMLECDQSEFAHHLDAKWTQLTFNLGDPIINDHPSNIDRSTILTHSQPSLSNA